MRRFDDAGRGAAAVILVSSLLLAGCADDRCTPNPGDAMWAVYADDHGTGSRIIKAEEFYGDIDAVIARAPKPAYRPQVRYPYAGLAVFVSPDKRATSLRDVEGLLLEYRLNGPLEIVLEQEGVAPEREFRAPLPATETFQTAMLRFDRGSFRQPGGAGAPSSLKDHPLVAIKFQIPGEDGGIARFVLRRVEFFGTSVCVRRRG